MEYYSAWDFDNMVTVERCLWFPGWTTTSVLTLLPPVFSVGPSYRCDNYTEFSCKTNYRCIPKWAVCNGVNDCRDNSDEQDCGRRGGSGGGSGEQLTRRGGWISRVILPLFASNNMLHFIAIL